MSDKGRKLPLEGAASGEPPGGAGETGEPPTGAGKTGETPAAPGEPAAAPGEPAAAPGEISVREVPSWRLILTLAVAGSLAGLAIVLVFGWAEPRIEAHRAAALRAAIQEVLGGPERYETLYVVDGSLTAALPAGVDSAGLDRIYAGYAADGRRVGFAIAGEQPGYQDIIGLIFGYDAEGDELLGMKVLESKETPGLGDKIEKDSAFVSAFRGVVPPIDGVKAGEGTGSEHEVDMITGATISSRTVIAIINERIGSMGPMIEAYMGGAPTAEPAVAAAEAAKPAVASTDAPEPAVAAAEAGG